jgi:hypothetical protein
VVRTIRLWACPPLRARITQPQCERNRARALDSEEAVAAVIPCSTCLGVRWWAERTGEPPREVAAATLLREHRDNEATRLRLAGPSEGAMREGHRARRRPGGLASAWPAAFADLDGSPG